MMVHDYDDERTLEEEENLSGAESVAAELNDLEKVQTYKLFLYYNLIKNLDC